MKKLILSLCLSCMLCSFVSVIPLDAVAGLSCDRETSDCLFAQMNNNPDAKIICKQAEKICFPEDYGDVLHIINRPPASSPNLTRAPSISPEYQKEM